MGSGVEGGLRHAQGVQRARLSVPLHPVQPSQSPQLHQPSAGSSPRGSESLLDHLSGRFKACELHPCSNQCLKDCPSVNPSGACVTPPLPRAQEGSAVLVSVEWVLSPLGMPASPDERRQAPPGPR